MIPSLFSQVEAAGKEVRHTKPRYLWRVKGEEK